VRASERERVAIERGADQLIHLIRFHFRRQPRRLKRFEQSYAQLCYRLYSALDKDFQRRTGSRP
jgi:hypothetical protein